MLRFPDIAPAITQWAANALVEPLSRAGFKPDAPPPQVWSTELTRLTGGQTGSHDSSDIAKALSSAFHAIGLKPSGNWESLVARVFDEQEPTPFLGNANLVREALVALIDAGRIQPGLQVMDLDPPTSAGQAALRIFAPKGDDVLCAATGAMDDPAPTLRHLIALGAVPAQPGPYGQGALLLAASEWMPEPLALLFDAPPGPDAEQVRGLLESALRGRLGREIDGTPIPVPPARRHDQRETVRVVAKRLAELSSDIAHINRINEESGETPLHLAVRSTPPGVVRILMQQGADPKVPNRLGETPMDLAAGDETLTRVLSGAEDLEKTESSMELDP